MITDPRSAFPPDASQVASAYPPGAVDRNIGGGVTLNCAVTAAGGVQGCSVVSETPTGLGFGKAALSLTHYFRMKPGPKTAAPSTAPRSASRSRSGWRRTECSVSDG